MQNAFVEVDFKPTADKPRFMCTDGTNSAWLAAGTMLYTVDPAAGMAKSSGKAKARAA